MATPVNNGEKLQPGFSSLRARLLIVVAFSTLLPIIVGMIVAVRVINDTLTNSLSEYFSTRAQLAAQSMGETLDGQLDLLTALSANQTLVTGVDAVDATYRGEQSEIDAAIAERDARWLADPTTANPLVNVVLQHPLSVQLHTFQQRFPQFGELFITDRFGANIAATNPTSDYWQADEAWWQAAWNGGSGAIYIADTIVFDESSGVYSIDLVIPIYDPEDSTRVIGLLVGTFQSTELATQIEALAFAETGRVLLTTSTGENLLGLAGSGTTTQLNIPADILAVADASVREPQLVELRPGGRDYVYAQHITGVRPEVQALDWHVVVMQSESEVLQSANQTLTLVFVGGLIFAGLMLAAVVVLSRNMTRPLVALTAAARQLGSGDWNTRVKVSTQDEFGELGNAFNVLAGELQTTFSQLEQRVSERTNDLETTVEIAAATNQVRELSELLHRTVNLIRDRFNFYYVQVFTVEDDNLALLRDGTGYMGQRLLEKHYSVSLTGNTPIARAYQSAQAVVVNDTANDPGYVPNDLLPETRSELAIPLRSKDTVIGILDIQHNRAYVFDEGAQRLFESLANQVSVTFENVRLFEDSQRRANQLEIVAQVSAEAATNLDMDSLLWSVANLTKESFNLYHAHIYLLDDAGTTLVLAAGAGDVGRQMVAEKRTIPLSHPNSIVALSARSREGVLVNDVTLNQDFLPHPLLPGTRAELAVPMIVGNQLVGVLDVQSDVPGRFDREDLQVQTTLAAQIAVAVENARAFEHTERARQEVERVYATSVDLIGSASLSTGYFKTLNPAWEAVLGWTAEELMSKPYIEFVHPEDVDATTHAAAEQLRAGKKVISFENRYLTKDGDYRWLSWNAAPDVAADMIYFVTRDITEARAVEVEIEKRIAELEIVAEMNVIVSSLTDTDELLQTAVDLTKERFNLYHAHVYVLDPTGKTLVLAAGAGAAGQTMKARHHQIPLSREHSLVARAARTREPVVVNDITSTPDFLPNPILPDTRSEVALPLIVGDTLLGVLDVQSAQLDYFTEEDVQVKRILAGQIAVALQNAQSYTAVQEGQQEAQLLYEVSTLITQAEDEQALVDAFVQHLKHPAATSVSLVLNGDGDFDTAKNITIVGDWRSGDQQNLRGMTVAIADFPVMKTFDRQRIVWSNDVAHDPAVDELSKASLQAFNTAAYIAVPLTVGMRWVATLTIASAQARIHDQTEVRRLRAISEQLTTAVERMRLNRQVARRAAEIETVANIGAQIATNLDMNSLLWSVANLTKERFHRYHAHIYLLDGAQENLVLAAGAGEAGVKLVEEGHTIPLNRENSLVARAARTRTVTVVDDVRQDPQFLANKYLPETQSEMAVPIVYGDQLLGVLDIQDNKVGAFSEIDMQANLVLANQIAVALQNARSFEQVQLFADVQTNTPVGIYVWRLENLNDAETLRLIAVNPAAERAMGFKAEAIVGKRFLEVFPQMENSELLEVYANVVRTGQDVDLGETVFDGEDGEQISFAIRAFPLPNQSVGISFEDITGRKRQEQALRESESRFRDIAATLPGAIFQFTAKDGVWTTPYMSERIYDITGVRAEEIMADLNNFLKTIHPDDLEDYTKSINEVLKTLHPWYYEGRIIHAETGEIIWWQGLSQPSVTEKGEVVFNGVVLDITDRKRQEEEIELRARETETVALVGSQIATNLDVDELLWSVANLTRDNFQHYYAHIYLLDETGGNLTLVAGAGEVGRTLVAQGHRIPLDRPNSLVARAARSRQVTVVNDVRKNPDFLPNKLLPDTLAEMAVPIVYGEQLLGVLDIQDSHVDAFTEVDIQAKQVLANQIAVALQNARQFSAAQQRLLFLQTTNRIADLARSNTDLVTFLEEALDSLAKTFGADNGVMSYYDKEHDQWHGYVGFGGISTQTVHTFNDPGSTYPHGLEVIRTGYLVAIDDVRQYPDFPQSYIDNLGIKSVLTLPVFTGDETQGVIFINYNRQQHKFTADELNLARALATQISLNIDRKRAEEEQQVLLDISTGLNNAATPQDVLDTIAPFGIIHDASIATLSYIDLNQAGQPEWIETVASWPAPDPNAEQIETRYYLPMLPFAKLWMSSPYEPLLIRDVMTDERVDPVTRSLFDPNSSGGFAVLPFYLKDQWIGLMTFSWAEPHTFTHQERNVFSAVMRQAASTVQALRAADEVRRRAEQSATLAEANAALSLATNEDEILAAIAQFAEDRGVTISALAYFEVDENNQPVVIDTRALRSGDGLPIPLSALPMTRVTANDYPMLAQVYGQPDAPLFFENMHTDPLFAGDEVLQEYLRQVNTTASIVIPLKTGEGWQGLLSFSWTAPQTFDEDTRAFFTAIQPSTASVVASRRAYLAEEAARHETELLYLVTNKLAEATERDQLLDAVSVYGHMLSADASMLLYIDSDSDAQSDWLEVVASWTKDGSVANAAVGQRFKLSLFPFSKVWMSTPNNAVLVHDVMTDERFDDYTRQMYLDGGTRASVIMPMNLQGRWIGLGVLSWKDPQQFSAQDQRIFTAIAQQSAPAIDAVRLLEQTQRRASQMETVARVSAATTTILDVDHLLQSVSDLTKQSFGLYHAHIYLLDEAGQNLVLSGGAGEPGRIMKERKHSIPLNRENSLVARAARTRQPVIANDVENETGFMPNPLLPETRSEMAVPMVIGDELIGVLDVQSQQIGRFNDEDARINATLAAQVAIAVDNARAFEHEQKTVQQLRELDRLKQQFLANMSHELRTPLNSIIGYSEVLLDGVDGDLTEDAIEDVNAIHQSGKHLLAIINDILDLAKIEAGQMYLDRKAVDLDEFLKDVIRANHILIKDKPVELRLVDNNGSGLKVYADPIRLRQIMNNLISNAIKFTEEGSVTVHYSLSEDNKAYIAVQDTGIGMKAEDVPVIFEQFRQVDGSSTRRAGGTGLGLTITRRFVEMHGGEIYAESEYGVGTTMSFTVPVYQPEKVR